MCYNSCIGIICCVFRPAFGCCVHPKTGWKTFFSAVFNFFSSFQTFFGDFTTEITEKRVKMTNNCVFSQFLLLFKACRHANAGQLPTDPSCFSCYFCAFLSIFFLFFHCDRKKWKTCFNAKIYDFDQQTACGAPVRWSKYTTIVNRRQPTSFRLTTLPCKICMAELE